MSKTDEIKKQSEILLSWILHRYGSQLDPDMMDGLRAAVETVEKNIIRLRCVKLENSDGPLTTFIPFRKEG
jgi:hypothetical protein